MKIVILTMEVFNLHTRGGIINSIIFKNLQFKLGLNSNLVPIEEIITLFSTSTVIKIHKTETFMVIELYVWSYKTTVHISLHTIWTQITLIFTENMTSMIMDSGGLFTMDILKLIKSLLLSCNLDKMDHLLYLGIILGIELLMFTICG